jgi:hypothetical protein
MAIWTAHRHLRFARLSSCLVAVTLPPRGIGNMRSHRPALGAADAPIPFSLANLQLFGRHLTLLAAPLRRQPAACFRLVESEALRDGLRTQRCVRGLRLCLGTSAAVLNLVYRDHGIQRPLNDLIWRRFRLRFAEDRGAFARDSKSR